MEQTTPDPRADRDMELLLNQLVEEDDPALPEDFARKVFEARPFAAWETRHRRHWGTPAAVLGVLAVSSAALGLAPLFRLGPTTALDVWAHLLAVSLVRPLAVAADSVPLLARGVSTAFAGSPGVLGAIGAGALVALVPLVVALLPVLRRHRVRDAAPR